MRLHNPQDLVVMEFHQNIGATLTGDPEYRPDDWTRKEFFESDAARLARANLESWLYHAPLAIDHGLWLMSREPAPREAGKALAVWLDQVLYGGEKAAFPLEERYAIQVTADSMARADFCRGNFGEVAHGLRETGREPRPLPSRMLRR